MTNFEWLRSRLTASIFEKPEKVFTMSELEKSEWSPEFEKLMRNRLLVGALRYGRLRAAGKPTYDRIKGAQKRLKQYQETGNLETLVDVANMMLLEFIEGRHPKRHFNSLSEDHTCA